MIQITVRGMGARKGVCAMNPSDDARQAWTTPCLERFDASAAENTPGPSTDGADTLS